MSDPRVPAARPVSLVTIVVILAGFGLFLWVVRLTYHRNPNPAMPFDDTPEKLPKDLSWQATPESRRAYLDDLRARQNQQLEGYGWTDRKAGVVRIPIDRAMELIVRDNGAKSSSK